ncbi:MAG TPA: TIGR03435 family protein [Acidobacteriaceae bacterium]|nr:TIGR03435 family protein [Acidobacteriaceae bacterium]
MGRRGYGGRKYWMVVAARIAVLVTGIWLMAGVPLWAQGGATPAVVAQQAVEMPTGSFAFEVATFKPSGPDSREGGGFFPTGYRVDDYALWWIVKEAYFGFGAQGHDLVGLPGWTENERYDVNARFDEATAPAWAKLPKEERLRSGRVVLRQLLAERCKLVAHTVPTMIDGYVLVVGKGGSRMVETKPGETYPPGARGVGDGLRTLFSHSGDINTESYFNTTMGSLVERLGAIGVVIEDRTGLTGHYDFVIRRLNPVDAEGKRIVRPQPEDVFDLSGTGLEFRRAKIPSENLVVDHIERPSAN